MANIKISELNELETKNDNDLLAIVDSANNETKKIKVETLVPENFELKLIADEEPEHGALVQGECYYNTTTNKIYRYVGSGTYVDLGEPKTGILYIIFSEKATFAYDGETMVSVGGGSGSQIIIGDETEATEDTKLLVDTSGPTDTLKYKDVNAFKELQIKALDSMPVGTVVEFNGQASDIPVGWEQVSSKSYVAYELYNNASGSNTDITLSDNVSNYEYIEIYFQQGSIRNSLKIEGKNGSISLNSFAYTNHLWFYSTTYTIANNTMNVATYCDGWIDNGQTALETPSNMIKIYKVIGYKEV